MIGCKFHWDEENRPTCPECQDVARGYSRAVSDIVAALTVEGHPVLAAGIREVFGKVPQK